MVVHSFPDHYMYLTEFDDLSTAETKLLVVIQNCVHVLDPHSIHWAIKDIPTLVFRFTRSALSDECGQDPISPEGQRD